jgi:hypothetical protein
MKSQRGAEVYLYSFFNLGARCRRVVNATPRPLYPGKETGTHCTYKGLGREGPEPVSMGVENLAPIGILSPDRPPITSRDSY